MERKCKDIVIFPKSSGTDIPRQFHSPDCFTVLKPSAHMLIWAAEGISALNVALFFPSFQALAAMNDRMYTVCLHILRLGGEAKEMLLDWLSKCLSANRGQPQDEGYMGGVGGSGVE